MEITAANGSPIAVEKCGIFKLNDDFVLDNTFITPSIPEPIISVPNLVKDDNVIICSPDNNIIIKNSIKISAALNEFISLATTSSPSLPVFYDPLSNLLKVPIPPPSNINFQVQDPGLIPTVPVMATESLKVSIPAVENSLSSPFSDFYPFNSQKFPISSSKKPPFCNPALKISFPELTYSDNFFDMKKPINHVHRYSTIKTRTVEEEVRLWHRIMGHCDLDTLISLVSYYNYHALNLPSAITPKQIRKFFPFDCPDCPAGNLQQRHSTFSPSTAIEVGDEFEVDFKGRWTGSDGRPAPTFGKHLYSFSAIDTISSFAIAKLCRNRIAVVNHLEELRLLVKSKSRILRSIRCDNEFSTSAVKLWALENKIQI